MIFGQGAMRCHPYLFEELQTLEQEESEGLHRFDTLLLGRLGHVAGNLSRALVHGLSGAMYAGSPRDASDFSERWYCRISRFSASLALCADAALGVLGGDIKRRELLSARLGDVHSELFIACSILKYHDLGPRSEAATAHAEYAVQRALYAAQAAMLGYFANFPVRILGWLLRVICFPTGLVIRAPDDAQIRKLGALIMEPNPVRDALATYVYVSADPDDAVGRVESTYRALLEIEAPWLAFVKARARGALEADNLDEALAEAADKHIIEEKDVERLLAYEARRYDCLLTDQFDQLV
jgi:acyl-CoA dehydrogenase